ncbi:MAG: hypothetical protein NDJ89_12840 [Oligoflexia bacterium]|nr:hypothetical protein [Oligoflexia bacterium]
MNAKLLATLAMLSSMPAFGAAEEPLRLEVPRSRIELSEASSGIRPSGTSWEVAASSWSPSALKLKSVVAGMPSYQSAGLPTLSVSRLSPILRGSLGNLELKLGLGLLRMTREATIETGTQARRYEQSLYLIPARAGVEYRPAVEIPGGISPYSGLALMPMLGLTPRSAIEKGGNTVGLTVEGRFGLLRRLELPLKPELDVGVAMTAGTLGGASTSGFGVLGGVRLDLGA